MSVSTTVVISCAGTGSRLGLGCTKALVEICGKPLICWQLSMLSAVPDVRVVVGYQYEQVIDVVLGVRRDVTFVFNREYRTTGTGSSLSAGACHGNDYVVSLDGDLLVHPHDLASFVHADTEAVGVSTPSSDQPIFVEVEDRAGALWAKRFTRETSMHEWTGLVKIRRDRLMTGGYHVYHCVEPALPLRAVSVRAREIDTYDDYQRAVTWVDDLLREGALR